MYSKHSPKSEKSSTVSRRRFIRSAAAGGAILAVAPRTFGAAGSASANDKLNIAGIGVGGRGRQVLRRCDDANIVALCDVDDKYSAKAYEQFPDAKRYTDYRVMLDKQKDIDAVVIATPDHLHFPIAMAAIAAGKHVYVEKPLTHTIEEARLLTDTARKAGVISQMGTQGTSMEGRRLIKEWIDDGAIGAVRKVKVWTDRPAKWWVQGVEAPTDTPDVPKTLDWDLWLGPAAERPYNPAYAPFLWRGWWDFGTGALGDMGCHLFDAPCYALDLGYPSSVEASFTPFTEDSPPLASVIRYEFPARGNKPAVTLTWRDGGIKPARPKQLEEGRRMGNRTGGVLLIGDDGTIMAKDENAREPKLIPETRHEAYKQPKQSIPRSIGHQAEWIKACKEGGTPSAHFDYAGPLTETVLLGNLAIRSGQKLEWDGPNMRCTNVPEANAFVSKQYRDGWKV
jgi:predicted dehydrogenase